MLHHPRSASRNPLRPSAPHHIQVLGLRCGQAGGFGQGYVQADGSLGAWLAALDVQANESNLTVNPTRGFSISGNVHGLQEGQRAEIYMLENFNELRSRMSATRKYFLIPRPTRSEELNLKRSCREFIGP